MKRTNWRADTLTWAVSGLIVLAMVLGCTDLLVGEFAWWRLATAPLSLCYVVFAAWRMVSWQVTADAAGLAVRTGRRVQRLAWSDVIEATADKGASLRLRTRGSCPAKDLLIPSTGFRRPRRPAAEITAMIHRPALRPAG